MVAGNLSNDKLFNYMEVFYPHIGAAVNQPPPFVLELFSVEQGSGEWKRSGKKSKKQQEYTLWDFWKEGADLSHLKGLQAQARQPESPAKHSPAPFSRFHLPASESKLTKTSKKRSKLAPKPTPEEEDDAQELIAAGYGHLLADVDDYFSDEEAENLEVSENDLVGRPPTDSESEFELDNMPPPPTARDALERQELFLSFFGLKTLPSIPKTKRDVSTLLDDGDVWSFSREERRAVARLIEGEAKRCLDEESIAEFETLTALHETARTKFDEATDNVRVSLLSKIQLVGATTTGAAKLGGVLTGFSPKILVIEEAGQVLEAHVLSSLVPSVEHVIAIGDPLQLRPSVNTYELSMDNRRGRELFRFDMSLMERLALAGLPMSQLLVQRRMAPNISSLIRNALYPSLQDHETVAAYPEVAGMQKNLFFLDHSNKEAGGGDSGSSKTNRFEAEMACDLALYLLKQGPYKKEGDIVILCAYLGQMIEIRDMLKGKVEVIIDERDQDKLVQTMGDEESAGPDLPPNTVARTVSLNSQIYLRTVDNFQGEEAKIVILSLVRNAGSADVLDPKTNATIGFLRSNNRSNVALSRAQHGMYILGNAEQLAGASDMWRSVVNDLADQGAVGPGFPICCKRHGQVVFIDAPGKLPLVSPNGGCNQPCDKTLVKCGHKCTRACHPDDEEHETFQCREKCSRVHSVCGHPCERRCYENCGNCLVRRENVELPCGHVADVFWYVFIPQWPA